MQAHYARQRRAMNLAAEKHLAGLATWDLPKAGMFVLFKVRMPGSVGGCRRRRQQQCVCMCVYIHTFVYTHAQ